MLSVLDSALADARTLAHRIVHQDCHYAIETETTRATLPNYGRIPGDGPLGEGARGLSEGASYDPKPTILHSQKLTLPQSGAPLCPGAHLRKSASVPTGPSH